MTNTFIILYPIGFLMFVFIAGSLIDFLLRHSFVGSRYRLFAAPGIIIHELSHTLAALMMGAKIKEINVTDPSGGYVIHTKPIFHFGQTIISLAPIFGITAAFVGLTALLEPDWIKPYVHQNFSSILNNAKNIELTNWQTLLYIYLTLSLATCLAPSKQDMKLAARGLLVILAIIFLLLLTPLNSYINHFFNLLSTPILLVAIFLIFALILSTGLFILTKLLFTHR